MPWLVRLGGQQLGPIPDETLMEWAKAGRLQGEDMVWQPGMPAWIPVRNVPTLAPSLRKRIIAPDGKGDKALEWVVPVNRSPWALAAGYFGLFSFLGIFAPIAIFTGIMALRDIRRNPETLGKGRAIFGLVMGVLGCVFLIAILAGAFFSK